MEVISVYRSQLIRFTSGMWKDHFLITTKIDFQLLHKLQELLRWNAVDNEVEQYMKEVWEENKKNPFDMKVANAMANENVSMAIKNNK